MPYSCAYFNHGRVSRGGPFVRPHARSSIAQDVADFVTLVSTYAEGFSVVTERNGSVIPGVYEPVMQLACLDASLAVKPVFARFSSVCTIVTTTTATSCAAGAQRFLGFAWGVGLPACRCPPPPPHTLSCQSSLSNHAPAAPQGDHHVRHAEPA